MINNLLIGMDIQPGFVHNPRQPQLQVKAELILKSRHAWSFTEQLL